MKLKDSYFLKEVMMTFANRPVMVLKRRMMLEAAVFLNHVVELARDAKAM